VRLMKYVSPRPSATELRLIPPELGNEQPENTLVATHDAELEFHQPCLLTSGAFGGTDPKVVMADEAVGGDHFEGFPDALSRSARSDPGVTNEKCLTSAQVRGRFFSRDASRDGSHDGRSSS
jgi:hypothetical protein